MITRQSDTPGDVPEWPAPEWPCDACGAVAGDPCEPQCPDRVPEVDEDLNLY